MKIAMFSDCYLDLTGGVVSSINAQKQELEKLGHTVYVFSPGFRRRKKVKQQLARQKIFIVPSCKLLFRGLTPVSRRPRVVERWLERNFPELAEFTVFHIHYEGGCSIAGIRLGRKLGVSVVQTMHGREDMGEMGIIPWGLRTFVAVALNEFHSWYLPHSIMVKRDNYLAPNLARARMWNLMINHANQADLVLSPSQHFKRKLEQYGVKRRIEVLPNGVPDELLKINRKIRRLKAGESLRIVWHSRVSAEKRIMPFLEALAMVQEGYRLEVFGEGGELMRAKNFVRAKNLKVFFHGDLPFKKILPMIAKCHLDVLVSDNTDTFGMTLIEAEALGIPVMICDADMKEIIPRGGYVISEDTSAKAMAGTIVDLIENPEKISKMSKVMLENRDEIRQSKRVRELVEIYQQVRIETELEKRRRL